MNCIGNLKAVFTEWCTVHNRMLAQCQLEDLEVVAKRKDEVLTLAHGVLAALSDAHIDCTASTCYILAAIKS